MAQPAYDALSEKRQLESAGIAAPQADAIVDSMTRAMTVNQQMAQDLGGVNHRLNGVETRLNGVETRLNGVETRLSAVESELAEVKTDLTDIKIDLTEVKAGLTGLKDRSNEMATSKDLDAAISVLRADVYRALWVQGLSLGTLILGLAVVVATAAVF